MEPTSEAIVPESPKNNKTLIRGCPGTGAVLLLPGRRCAGLDLWRRNCRNAWRPVSRRPTENAPRAQSGGRCASNKAVNS